MLTTEMIQNLYEGSYEQDELNPYDAAGNIVDTVPGAVALIRYINRAIKIISTWKFPNGTRIRFRANHGLAYASTPETGYDFLEDDETGALSYAAGFVLPIDAIIAGLLRYVTLPVAFTHDDDYYKGWILKFPDNVEYFVTGSVGNVLTLDSDIDTMYNNYPFILHPTNLTVGDGTNYAINLPGFISVNDVYDRTASSEMSRAVTQDFLDSAETSIGTPTQYSVYGNRLYFDTALQSPRNLRIRYWKYPRMITTVANTVDLPEAFHEAVFLCAKEELLRRIGEATEAYATHKTLESMMINLRTEADFEQDNAHSRLYPEE